MLKSPSLRYVLILSVHLRLGTQQVDVAVKPWAFPIGWPSSNLVRYTGYREGPNCPQSCQDFRGYLLD